MIDETIDSLNIKDNYEILIICDGYKENNINAFKSGKITSIDIQKYELYKKNLKEKYSKFTIIEREKRYGFAVNIKYGMEISKNEYVLIVQHDFIFNKKIDFDLYIQKYFIEDDMNYLTFLSNTMSPYYKDRLIFNNIKYFNKPKYIKSNIEPLIFWYDRNHLTRKSFYLNEVFNNKEIKVKNFVEDSFGNYMLNKVKKEGLDIIFNYFKSFIIMDNVLYHINGRKFC